MSYSIDRPSGRQPFEPLWFPNVSQKLRQMSQNNFVKVYSHGKPQLVNTARVMNVYLKTLSHPDGDYNLACLVLDDNSDIYLDCSDLYTPSVVLNGGWVPAWDQWHVTQNCRR
jgi:hypothetical protein